MAIHKIHRKQVIEAGLADCWDFFANPRNLARLTPPALDFQVLTEVPQWIYAGLMIEYRVRPLWGIRMTWLTEITHVNEYQSFVDEQRVGPYRLWHHEHHFRELDRTHTEIRDIVHYILPLSPLSALAHRWLVEPQLRKIFDHRERNAQVIFNEFRKGAAASA